MIINLEITDEQGANLARFCNYGRPYSDGNTLITQLVAMCDGLEVWLALGAELELKARDEAAQVRILAAADAFEAVSGLKLDRDLLVMPGTSLGRLGLPSRDSVVDDMAPIVVEVPPVVEDPAPIVVEVPPVVEDPAPSVKEDPVPGEGDTPTPAVG